MDSNPGFAMYGCVTVDKSLNFSIPQYFYLKNEDSYPAGYLQELTESIIQNSLLLAKKKVVEIINTFCEGRRKKGERIYSPRYKPKS